MVDTRELCQLRQIWGLDISKGPIHGQVMAYLPDWNLGRQIWVWMTQAERSMPERNGKPGMHNLYEIYDPHSDAEGGIVDWGCSCRIEYAPGCGAPECEDEHEHGDLPCRVFGHELENGYDSYMEKRREWSKRLELDYEFKGHVLTVNVGPKDE